MFDDNRQSLKRASRSTAAGEVGQVGHVRHVGQNYPKFALSEALWNSFERSTCVLACYSQREAHQHFPASICPTVWMLLYQKALTLLCQKWKGCRNLDD